MEDDSKDAFSQTLEGVLHVEDIRLYIHCKFEIIGNKDIWKDLSEIFKEDKTLNPESGYLQNPNILQYMDYEEFDELEWIRIVLSRIHDQFIWVGDKPTMITKELFHLVTSLDNVGIVHVETITVKTWKQILVPNK